jgi:hypothetical protein
MIRTVRGKNRSEVPQSMIRSNDDLNGVRRSEVAQETLIVGFCDVGYELSSSATINFLMRPVNISVSKTKAIFQAVGHLLCQLLLLSSFVHLCHLYKR